jgi:hypothetical protein
MDTDRCPLVHVHMPLAVEHFHDWDSGIRADIAPVAVEVPLDAADIEAFEQGRDLVDGLQELVPRQIRCAGQLAVELCAVRRRNGGAEVRGLRTDCMRRCAAR